jgi:hypothetical protein
MLDERLVGIVAGICEGLLESSDALTVSLVDERLREIAHAGAELPAELELPRPAQELVQHVGKHQVFTMPVALGSRRLAGRRGLLVVVFGNRSSLGLVRLRAGNVSREIEDLVAGAIQPDDGGPSGAVAAAVAWPPARRNRGSG